jgi:hypothetical protein
MTVDELISELRKHPGNAKVYVRGYEDGVDDVTRIAEIQLCRDVHVESYYGAHQPLDEDGRIWDNTIQSFRVPDDAESGLQLLGGDDQ